MFIITSPSKTQDFTAYTRINIEYTTPELLAEIQNLVSELKKYNIQDLMELMHISKTLADLNIERFRVFQASFNFKNSKPAILAFKGDVYTGLDVEKYTTTDFEFAQKHLGIISGLYGLLRPLDLIQPYRLEMATALKIGSHKNLYEFWDDKVTKLLAKRAGKEIVINLASQEYSKVISEQNLQNKFINIIFKESKNGSYKIIGLFAKKARGHMINYIIKNRISSLEQIKEFDINGYRFASNFSDQHNLVFIR